MAKNQEPESKPEPSSDSDELLSTDSGSESGSDSEPEPEPEPQQTPPPKPQNPPPAAESDSESESGSEYETDSEAESDPKPDPAVKTPEQKPKPSLDQVSPVKGSAVVGVKKGGAKVVEGKKIVGKKDGNLEASGVEDSSKKLFQRVFSEGDEIVLLKGSLDFIGKKKSDPIAAIDEFLEFIKKKLQLDVSKAQLLNKMKRLRGKYKSNAARVKEGQEVKISRPHERESFELSKKIWGGLEGESSNGDGVLENGKLNGSVVKKCGSKSVVGKALARAEDIVTVAVKPPSDDDNLRGLVVPNGGVSDGVGGVSVNASLEKRIMGEELKNVDPEKQRALKRKLCEIEVVELDLCAKRWEYMAEKARLLIADKKAAL